MSAPSQSDRPQNIVIFGTGQGAETARRYFEWDTAHKIVGHVVDAEFLLANTFDGRPVTAIEHATTLFPPSDHIAFVPIGSARMNQTRADKYQALKSLGYRFATYVHASNTGARHANIGENCFILENQSLNFDVTIGNNVTIWSGCQIGDRCIIDDHAFLAAHVVLNGDVSVGEYAYLGSNCNISNHVRIGRQSFIGANALITADTDERATHVVEATPSAGIDSLRFTRLLRNHH